jgi:hypothetical protein
MKYEDSCHICGQTHTSYYDYQQWLRHLCGVSSQKQPISRESRDVNNNGQRTLNVNEALDGVDNDGDRQGYQEDTVEECRQYLCPFPSIGEKVGFGAFENSNGVKRYDQGDDIAAIRRCKLDPKLL